MPPHSPLKPARSATSPLSLSAEKKLSEWTAILYSAASKEAEWGEKIQFFGAGAGRWGRDAQGGRRPPIG